MTERYKCHTCKLILKESDLIEECCPICHNKDGLQKMCKLDHNNCSHDIVHTTMKCPECGAFVCPECGSHDIFVVSRVTGYLAEIRGWNQGKQAEFADRTRYTI